jgi:hypothetical protein
MSKRCVDTFGLKTQLVRNMSKKNKNIEDIKEKRRY